MKYCIKCGKPFRTKWSRYCEECLAKMEKGQEGK
jgi:DNA-directed RNA polymerase subunit N (RpoN/RPB10)